ncbi:Nicotinate-nucleotide--dimethylbenzimidazole phosphoribosyltransferase [Ruminococcaceae bacterium BL-6]|nr:Nicotinate-nucleotide--dimethylbenzimidazole phosphoribosyltransferase [Ruminococcaceae bacterium BL-6]
MRFKMEKERENRTVEQAAERIAPLSQEAMRRARRRWDSIAKPLHSLGLLEDAVVQIAGITGDPSYSIGRRAVAVFCADNGVVEEGVTQAGSEITALVAKNFTQGRASVCKMARVAHADVLPVDVGMKTDVEGVERRKTARGTGNMTHGPAMTPQQARAAVEAGIDVARGLKERGFRIAATGEMGIGNTTTSSAVVCVLLGAEVSDVTGRGSGLSDDGLLRKRRAIARAIRVNRPDPADPLDVLAKVGGFDLAALTGFFLGCAALRLPVLMDGFISAGGGGGAPPPPPPRGGGGGGGAPPARGCAALRLPVLMAGFFSAGAARAAARIAPLCADYILASHESAEPAGKLLLRRLGKSPLITAGMCLGEGTGAVAALPLLDMAFAVYRDMSTFGEIEMEAYRPFPESEYEEQPVSRGPENEKRK